jgi:plasmid stabilization system protein ParE
MTQKPIEFHPRAIVETRKARRWYAKRSPSAADHLMEQLDRAIERIANAPEQWPEHLHGTRFHRLKVFPYLVIYLVQDEAILVVAVAHKKRRPGYWKRRLP